MMARVTVFVTTMTACGGDSDDPLDNPNPIDNSSSQGGGENSDVKVLYFTLCTDWNYTDTEVKQYMSKYNYLIFGPDESSKNSDWWAINTQKKPNYRQIQVFYNFDDNGKLRESHAWYGIKTEQELQFLISETERIYGVTLERRGIYWEENPKNYTLKAETYNGKEVDKYISLGVSSIGTGSGYASVIIYRDKPSLW